jgi:hypothetical protein
MKIVTWLRSNRTFSLVLLSGMILHKMEKVVEVLLLPRMLTVCISVVRIQTVAGESFAEYETKRCTIRTNWRIHLQRTVKEDLLLSRIFFQVNFFAFVSFVVSALGNQYLNASSRNSQNTGFPCSELRRIKTARCATRSRTTTESMPIFPNTLIQNPLIY